MEWHPVLVRALVENLKVIFQDGRYADKVLEHSFKNHKQWGKRDRQFMAGTIYEMVRWWKRLMTLDGQDWIPQNYFIRWVAFEKWKNEKDALGFLAEKIPESKIGHFEIKVENKLTLAEELSFPDWMVEKFQSQYGDDTRPILEALNTPAPVSMRVNTLKTTMGELSDKLISEGFEVAVDLETPTGIKLKTRKNVFMSECFKKGFFEVQDFASQKVAPLLNPKPGERIADVCAGAGGKTLHLAMLMENKGSLLASDVHARKLEQLKIRARRAGVSNLRIQLFESSKDAKKHYGKFDGVLIDAPCSGSGVIRRNPDTKWKLTPEELENLKSLQAELMERYAKLLKPGGRFVYATCSLLKEENEDQVERFLKSNPAFKLQSTVVRRPDLQDEDGFYAALLTSGEYEAH